MSKFRYRIKRQEIRKRGVSTVIGAVFIAIIVFTTIASYFAFQGNVSALLQQKLNERNQVDVQAKAESLSTIGTLSTTSCAGSSSAGTGLLYLCVANKGSSAIEIVQVLVLSATCNSAPSGQPAVVAKPIVLGVGAYSTTPTPISTGYTYSGNPVCVEALTSLGNIGAGLFPGSSGLVVVTDLSANPVAESQPVFDTAILIGAVGTPTGTVTFEYFSGSSCSGTANIVGTAVTVSNGQAVSSTQSFTTAGPYSWNAIYNGDSNNPVATSACEPLTVTSNGVGVGGSVFATGLVVEDLDHFYYFDEGSCDPTTSACPLNNPAPLATANPYGGYSIPATSDGNQLVFTVNIENVNPAGRTIYLYGLSYLAQAPAIILGQSGSRWFIFNLLGPPVGSTPNTAACPAFPTPCYTLPNTTPPTAITIYFGSNYGGAAKAPGAAGTVADYLWLRGAVTTGGSCAATTCPWGQNLPFTTSYYN